MLEKQNEKIWIFCQDRFDGFDNPFDSIDNVPMGDGGPPRSLNQAAQYFSWAGGAAAPPPSS